MRSRRFRVGTIYKKGSRASFRLMSRGRPFPVERSLRGLLDSVEKISEGRGTSVKYSEFNSGVSIQIDWHSEGLVLGED